MNNAHFSILLFLSYWLLSGLYASDKNNFLFIIVDDLRPELGCYGNQQVISPNIDRLAESGTLFSNAYCNVPVCGASRASVMTGLRPSKDRFVDYNAKAFEESKGVMDLAGLFRQNGYKTISIGKVYHERDDYLSSWDSIGSPLITSPSMRDYQLPINQAGRGKFCFKAWGTACEAADVPEKKYFTYQLADAAIDYIDKTEAEQKPWFLAVGFTKPHLPFVAPKKYWDSYQRSDFKLASNPEMPENAPTQAWHEWHELRKMYNDIPQTGAISAEKALELKHGYYACVSFTDAMIGRLLDYLDEQNLREKTTIVLWGDHGWQLGEHGLWCKHANFKTSLQAPLIVSAAGQKAAGPSPALVEFIDIYPSLCDLAGFVKPAHLQGKSFAPLLQDPHLEWKDAIYCRYHQADSIHTGRYLYTEWRHPQRNHIRAKMLYDHQRDPDENFNIVQHPEYRELAKDLSQKLQRHLDDFK